MQVQIAVGEHMQEGGQIGPVQGCLSWPMLCRRLLQRLAPVEHGRRIKPRPDALLRTALQPDAALPVHGDQQPPGDRKSTRLNSSHSQISYAVFCLKKKKKNKRNNKEEEANKQD